MLLSPRLGDLLLLVSNLISTDWVTSDKSFLRNDSRALCFLDEAPSRSCVLPSLCCHSPNIALSEHSDVQCRDLEWLYS